MTGNEQAARDALSRLLSRDASIDPFPWQTRLLGRFVEGRIPAALDIPTGLGKTSVMAIWLAARAAGAGVPRRLIYVVDRRAVVDQSTRVAEELREALEEHADLARAAGLSEGASLPISTLRGRFVDNREWLDDPASPAIIVGTVDMIGSRLLFQGYGTSRRMRPYQAAMLACDSLLVLDEAHLVPPFARLCVDLSDSPVVDWHAADPGRPRAPRIRRIALSATGRHGSDDDVFGLTERDRVHEEVGKRLRAEKRGEIRDVVDDKAIVDGLVEAVVARLDAATGPERLLVFANRRAHADAVEKALVKMKRADVELFVGARRIRERSNAAHRLQQLGYLAGAGGELERPAVLVATSAAEVGVDLDADHMIGDVVSWERTVQRLGRVNRRGRGSARIVFVATAAQREAAAEIAAAVASDEQTVEFDAPSACLALLAHLPADEDGRYSLSPGDLVDLPQRARQNAAWRALFRMANESEALRPAVTRPVLESWAMTSLKDHTGRPQVAPWIRGWVEDEEPRTQVAWRHHLPLGDDEGTTRRRVSDLFSAAPIQTSELLETETRHVADWLGKRRRKIEKRAAKDGVRVDSDVGVLLDRSMDVESILTQRELAELGKKGLERLLAGRTLVVRDTWGGLAPSGLLDETHDTEVAAIDSGDRDAPWLSAGVAVPFWVRRLDGSDEDVAEETGAGWIEIRRIPLDTGEETTDEDSPPPCLAVEIPRATTTDEESRASGNPQRLDDHHAETAEHARRLTDRLGLDDRSRDLLILAARLHDEGKRATRWQRAFHAPPGGDWAKTRGPVHTATLGGYRHELGSYLRVLDHPDVTVLDEADRDLVLHLIASHHGHARPAIPTAGCDDEAPTALQRHATDIAERFVRLQRRLGPWQLAWWETVLRAADQQASRANDARVRAAPPKAEAIG